MHKVLKIILSISPFVKKIIKKQYQKTHFHSIERKFETKIHFGKMKQLLEFKFFYPIPKTISFFSLCFKSSDQSQEDLAKFSYEKNKKIKNLRILLHVGKPLEAIS
jgi:hypothetical protein